MLQRPILLILALIVFSAVANACTCSDVISHSCNILAGGNKVVFLGTVVDVENPPKEGDRAGGVARYHFRVEERFTGHVDPEVDVFSGRGGGDCSFWFKNGEQYIVFAYPGEDGDFWTSICSGTQRSDNARPLISQLRAMRDGQPVARVYGSLRQTQQPYAATAQNGFDTPLGNTVLRFESARKRVAVKTDEDGMYSLPELPAGTYKITADLPPNLVLAETILSEPLPAFEIDAKSCIHQDFDALPTAVIRGRLLGNGRTMWNAPVELFAVGRYNEDERGWWEFVDEKKKYFEFDHVTPGEYILVFNKRDKIDTDVPYPRTFFKNARDLTRAEHITVGPGSQLLHEDIELTGGAATRKIKVHVVFEGGGAPTDSLLFVKGAKGEDVFPNPIGNNAYELNILVDSEYVISAETNFCEPETRGQPIELDAESAPSDLTISVPNTSCRPEE